MGGAMTLGLALGGVSAATSLLGSAGEASRGRAQTEAQKAQAAEYRRQADLARQKGDMEASQIDQRKTRLRREFQEKQARNRSLLAAGNVDMASGSALDVSLGNIDRFAADLSENSWQRALKEWETREQVKGLHYQADTASAQASYLGRTASSFGPSLLKAAFNGGTGFLSGYTMAGGKLSELWGSGAENRWDEVGKSGLIMRHPSGKKAFAPFK